LRALLRILTFNAFDGRQDGLRCQEMSENKDSNDMSNNKKSEWKIEDFTILSMIDEVEELLTDSESYPSSEEENQKFTLV